MGKKTRVAVAIATAAGIAFVAWWLVKKKLLKPFERRF